MPSRKFMVTTACAALLNGESLLHRVTVEADYVRIDNGHLIFRRHNHGYNAYPDLLRAFAPGSWKECVLVESVT